MGILGFLFLTLYVPITTYIYPIVSFLPLWAVSYVDNVNEYSIGGLLVKIAMWLLTPKAK